MRDTESKREREKKMVSEMIALYCKKKHHTKITRKKDGSHKEELCPECRELAEYARTAATDVRLWKRKLSAPIAGYTAINRR